MSAPAPAEEAAPASVRSRPDHALRRVRLVLVVVLLCVAPASWIFAADLMAVAGHAGRHREAKAVILHDVLRAEVRRDELAALRPSPHGRTAYGGTIMPAEPPFDPATLPRCAPLGTRIDRVAATRVRLWHEEARFRLLADRLGTVQLAALHSCLVAIPFGGFCAERLHAARRFSRGEIVAALVALGAVRRRGRLGCWRSAALG